MPKKNPVKLVFQLPFRLIHNHRFLRFAVVGCSGVLVNMGMLALFTEIFHLYYLISSIIAIELSILSNFMLNDTWTWQDRKKRSFRTRLFRYHVSAGISGLLFNWGLLLLLTKAFHIHYLLANLIGICFGMASNFILNNFWTFRKPR